MNSPRVSRFISARGRVAIAALLSLTIVSTLAGSAAAAALLSPPETSAITIPPGQIDRAIYQLDQLSNAILKKTGIPGMAVAVVHNDKVVYMKGFGVRKVGTSLRVNTDTVFELASVSKPLGAAVVARVV